MTPADLSAIKARWVPTTPTGCDAVCAGCNGSVLVDEGAEWEDGYLCHGCAQDSLATALLDIPMLLEEVERLRYQLDEARGLVRGTAECMYAPMLYAAVDQWDEEEERLGL